MLLLMLSIDHPHRRDLCTSCGTPFFRHLHMFYRGQLRTSPSAATGGHARQRTFHRLLQVTHDHGASGAQKFSLSLATLLPNSTRTERQGYPLPD
ncbi:hypothetical protein PM082_000224 [Marasmius tenuissimus]|nr:hypothetical protein PM082_000224 [Marasmius tenuissimus]